MEDGRPARLAPAAKASTRSGFLGLQSKPNPQRSLEVRGLTSEVRPPPLVRTALGLSACRGRLLLLLLQLTQQLLRSLPLLGIRLGLRGLSAGRVVSRVIDRLFGDVHALGSDVIRLNRAVALSRRHR